MGVLRPYAPLVSAIVAFTVAANALSLLVPRIIARAIDTFGAGQLSLGPIALELAAVAIGVFLFTYLQNAAQVYASERVARDLRTQLVAKLSTQDLAYIQRVTSATLLTNLTSDVDAVKLFVAQAVGALISSVFLILGASVLLLSINWRLGLMVIVVLPVIGVTFQAVLARVRTLFGQAQKAIDRLNKVINESVLGAPLVRLVNSQQLEYVKFTAANAEARAISLRILRLFSGMIPAVIFLTNLATLAILTFGGRFVIDGSMTLGDFAAFNAYLAILIFPVIVIGFMSNVIAQATASYARLGGVLGASSPDRSGGIVAVLRGDITLEHVDLTLGGRAVLKDVSMSAPAGTRTAIIGPTAAGKTQVLYLLTGLLDPTSGRVAYDGRSIGEYDRTSLHQQVGFVFQDATMFNLTLRENIAFSKTVRDEDLERAIATAELKEFIDRLPRKLDTIVSERGTSLSGGQKQRIMLARALALNPRVLLLDDFTARVDPTTERAILDNVRRNYPGLTLVSVTQKIAPVEDYDQIILLMEGEVLASGTHQHLLATCPEYVQIYDSQRSTRHYESVRAR
ncbi:MAG: ABC transporter ATP-binding protein [Acidobacteria bacterium]|nr:ABC transporter ATP-binding protein [Acidobacteriota bacterium]